MNKQANFGLGLHRDINNGIKTQTNRIIQVNAELICPSYLAKGLDLPKDPTMKKCASMKSNLLASEQANQMRTERLTPVKSPI